MQGERLMVFGRRHRWLSLLFVAALAAVFAVWLIAGGPLTATEFYGCEVCRAGRTDEVYLSIFRFSSVSETPFSRYYRWHVDGAHQHAWSHCGGHYRGVGFCRFADGSTMAGHLDCDAALAIVKSLPDRRTRKAFCQQFNISDPNSYSGCEMWRKIGAACDVLNAAYRANPHRTDWPLLVRRVGLYPVSAHSH